MSKPKTLSQLRKRIDGLDLQVIRLLKRRAALALQIGRLKRERGLPIFDGVREEQILRKLTKTKCSPFSPASARKVFKLILDQSRKLQR